MGENPNNTEINLTLTELARVGDHSGVFVDALYGWRTDKRGRRDRTLSLMIEIDEQTSYGARFVIEAHYVLNTKGSKKLRQDALDFDSTLAPAALKTFNPYSFFVSKPCEATVGHTSEGGRTVARAIKYQPAGETKLTPSGKYVRPESAQPAAHAAAHGKAEQPAQPPTTA